MKRGKYLYIIVILVLTLSGLTFGLYSTVIAQRAKNLYNFVISNKIVNIYIGKFKGSDEAKDINVESIIESLERRLKARRAVNFNIVKEIEDADLSISGHITKFIYSKKDPIDVFIPIGLVMDLFTNKNYARLEYEMSVLDTKSDKIVWKKYLKATITEFNMAKEESIPLITDRACYVFIKECFGKPKGTGKI